MRYDKQADTLLIPLSQVATVTRDGKAIDHANAWILNLSGAITITTKTEETGEIDEPSRPSDISGAKNRKR
ncbi:MAG: hypothetical protein JW388_0277 [Nitrospira sp.]|nr:hypothetical protein [Nitrospira sp.]